MTTLYHEQIAKRSYLIWEQAGRPDGQDMDHWLQAERELAALFGPKSAPAKKAAPKKAAAKKAGNGAVKAKAPAKKAAAKTASAKSDASKSAKAEPAAKAAKPRAKAASKA